MSAVPAGYRLLDLPPSPFVVANGPFHGKWEAERFVLAIRVEEKHCNVVGVCHGGMIMTMADMLLTVGSNIQANLSRFLPTISMTCDFLAPVNRGDWLEGRVEVLRTTRNLVFSDGLLTVGGEAVARASAILKLAPEPDPKFARSRYLP